MEHTSITGWNEHSDKTEVRWAYVSAGTNPTDILLEQVYNPVSEGDGFSGDFGRRYGADYDSKEASVD